jgi:nucleoid-associated protein YgaU
MPIVASSLPRATAVAEMPAPALAPEPQPAPAADEAEPDATTQELFEGRPVLPRTRHRDRPHTVLGAAATDVPFLVLAAIVALVSVIAVIWAVGIAVAESRGTNAAGIDGTTPVATAPAATASLSTAEATPRATPLGPVVPYVVRAGDTLRSLAHTFYGDEEEWRRILAANRDQIPNPDVLQVGTRLLIPAG